mmetsp:Transcript_109217/g.308026  ORF Transcript_109217/g.308026 Transcript_109217/m.308026 type:complete len:257 (+) Transcript_109217:668-1438(+)
MNAATCEVRQALFDTSEEVALAGVPFGVVHLQRRPNLFLEAARLRLSHRHFDEPLATPWREEALHHVSPRFPGQKLQLGRRRRRHCVISGPIYLGLFASQTTKAHQRRQRVIGASSEPWPQNAHSLVVQREAVVPLFHRFGDGRAHLIAVHGRSHLRGQGAQVADVGAAHVRRVHRHGRQRPRALAAGEDVVRPWRGPAVEVRPVRDVVHCAEEADVDPRVVDAIERLEVCRGEHSAAIMPIRHCRQADAPLPRTS